MTFPDRTLRDESGFTLVELMIVIVVLGILAGLVLFSVDPVKNAADHAVSNADEDTCYTAAAMAEATPEMTDNANDYLREGFICP